MRTSVAGRRLIQDFEGFHSTRYLCPAGLPTIGHGHVLRKNEVFTRITLRDGEALLVRDLEAVEGALESLVTAPLTQNQFDALASLIYNIGSGNFARSTLLKRLNEGRYAEAAEQFGRWVKSGDKTLPGLVKRRAAEMQLFLKV